MNPLITVVIPTIPPRDALLQDALLSVKQQTMDARLIVPFVEMDHDHRGAAVTRHRGLMEVTTPWVAFLDDDDVFMPHHLEKLFAFAEETGADYTYSWFETVPHGCDPFPDTHYTAPWDPQNPRQTTITTLVRTSLAQEIGFLGWPEQDTGDGMRAGEDWAFTLGCNANGKITHLVERTWYWRHHGGNTSGLGSRW